MRWMRRRCAVWILATALAALGILVAGAALLRANGARWLWDAAEAGNFSRTRLLLTAGVDIDCQPSGLQGCALQVAAARGQKEMVVYLLDHGADVGAVNEIGWTALHWASGNGRLEIAKLLIERGADVNAENIAGNTPLDLARRQGHGDVIALLREHGAKE